MNTVRFATGINRIISNAVLRKTPPRPNQSNDALINKLYMSFRSVSLTIYNMFSGFSSPDSLTLTDGTVLSFARLNIWISTVAQNFTTKHIGAGGRAKQFCDVFGKWLQLSTNQIIGTVLLFGE